MADEEISPEEESQEVLITEPITLEPSANTLAEDDTTENISEAETEFVEASEDNEVQTTESLPVNQSLSKTEQVRDKSEGNIDMESEKTVSIGAQPVSTRVSQKSRLSAKFHKKEQPRNVERQFLDMIGKHKVRNEELGKKEGALRHRLDVLESSMPAVMVWNIWRMAQGAPVTGLRRIVEKQFRHVAEGQVCPRTPSRHYDCRVREIEAERKLAQKRVEEARTLCAEKKANLEEKQKKLDEARRTQEERKRRLEDLTKELQSLRDSLEKMDGSSGDCVAGECGDIQCCERWMKKVTSNTSIKSIDIEYLERIQELAEAELCMKKQIADLEYREDTYMRTLQEADDCWSKLETDSTQSQLQQKQKLCQELAERVCDLEDQLEKMRSRLSKCKGELENYLSVEKVEALIGRDDDVASTFDKATCIKAKLSSKIVGGDDSLALTGDAASEARILQADRSIDRQGDLIGISDRELGVAPEDFEHEALKQAELRKYFSMLGSLDELDKEDEEYVCPPEFVCNDVVTSPTGMDAEELARVEKQLEMEPKTFVGKKKIPSAKDLRLEKEYVDFEDGDYDDEYVCDADFICNDVVTSPTGMDDDELEKYEGVAAVADKIEIGVQEREKEQEEAVKKNESVVAAEEEIPERAEIKAGEELIFEPEMEAVEEAPVIEEEEEMSEIEKAVTTFEEDEVSEAISEKGVGPELEKAESLIEKVPEVVAQELPEEIETEELSKALEDKKFIEAVELEELAKELEPKELSKTLEDEKFVETVEAESLAKELEAKESAVTEEKERSELEAEIKATAAITEERKIPEAITKELKELVVAEEEAPKVSERVEVEMVPAKEDIPVPQTEMEEIEKEQVPQKELLGEVEAVETEEVEREVEEVEVSEKISEAKEVEEGTEEVKEHEVAQPEVAEELAAVPTKEKLVTEVEKAEEKLISEMDKGEEKSVVELEEEVEELVAEIDEGAEKLAPEMVEGAKELVAEVEVGEKELVTEVEEGEEELILETEEAEEPLEAELEEGEIPVEIPGKIVGEEEKETELMVDQLIEEMEEGEEGMPLIEEEKEPLEEELTPEELPAMEEEALEEEILEKELPTIEEREITEEDLLPEVPLPEAEEEEEEVLAEEIPLEEMEKIIVEKELDIVKEIPIEGKIPVEVIEEKEEEEEEEEEEEVPEEVEPIIEKPEIEILDIEPVEEKIKAKSYVPIKKVTKPSMLIDPQIVSKPYLSVAEVEERDKASVKPIIQKYLAFVNRLCAMQPSISEEVKIIKSEITKTETVQTELVQSKVSQKLTQTLIATDSQTFAKITIPSKKIQCQFRRWSDREQAGISTADKASQTDRSPRISKDTKPFASIGESSKSDLERELRSISYKKSEETQGDCVCCACGKPNQGQKRLIAPLPALIHPIPIQPMKKPAIPFLKEQESCQLCPDCRRRKQKLSDEPKTRRSPKSPYVCDSTACICPSSGSKTKILSVLLKKFDKPERKDQSCMAKIPKLKDSRKKSPDKRNLDDKSCCCPARKEAGRSKDQR